MFNNDNRTLADQVGWIFAIPFLLAIGVISVAFGCLLFKVGKSIWTGSVSLVKAVGKGLHTARESIVEGVHRRFSHERAFFLEPVFAFSAKVSTAFL